MSEVDIRLERIQGLYASELRNGFTLFYVSPVWLLLGVNIKGLLDGSVLAKILVAFIMIAGILFSYLSIYYIWGSLSVYMMRRKKILNSNEYVKHLEAGVLSRFREHVGWIFLITAFIFNIVLIASVIIIGFE